MPRELSPEQKAQLKEALKTADPAMIEKYGNPLDDNDPRNWLPSERESRGLSDRDRLKVLELDMERISDTLGLLVARVMKQEQLQMVRDLTEEFKTNPEAATQKVVEMLSNLPGSRGPNGDEGPAYAGSTNGLKPTDLVETPDGVIMAQQIPGYRDDPNWSPSPDWKEANCMCPMHKAQRAAAAQDTRFDDPRGGMYL